MPYSDNMKRFFLVSFLLFLTYSISAHPIKLATGKVHIDISSKHVEVLLNFFIDDFEPAMRQVYPQPSFDYSNQSDIMQITIAGYIQQHLLIQVSDSVTKLKVKSISKLEDNICQVSLEGVNNSIDNGVELSISNTLLFAIYQKQSNMLQVSFDNYRPQMLQFSPADAKKVISIGR